MGKQTFPKTAASFNNWFMSFQKSFNANYKQFGYTASDAKAINAMWKTWQGSEANWNAFSAFFNAYQKFHNTQFASFQSFIQGYTSQIAKSKNFGGNWSNLTGGTASTKSTTAKKTTAKKTTAKKATAKKTTVKKATAKKATAKKTTAKKSTTNRPITARTTKTVAKRTSKRGTVAKPVTVKSIASNNGTSTNAPFVWFTSGNKKGSVNVWVGSSKNGSFSLPNGSKAAYVEYRTMGGKWNRLTSGNKFPFVYNYNGNGKKLFFRACWINTSGKKGSYSASTSWNVAGTSKAA